MTKQMPNPDNGRPGCHDLAISYIKANQELHGGIALIPDLLKRQAFGLERYGTPLQAFNGTNQGLQMYEELLDGIAYAIARIEECRERRDPREIDWSIALEMTVATADLVKSILDKENVGL